MSIKMLSPTERLFLKAIKEGQVSTTKDILEKHSVELDLNSLTDEIGNSPAWYAVAAGNLPLLKLLVEVGKADVKRKVDFLEETLLHLAIRSRGYVDVVEYLLRDCHAEVDVPDRDGDTPLMLACYYRFKEIVKILLHHGANVNYQNRTGFTVLAYFSNLGEMEWIKYFLENGSDVTLRNPLSHKMAVEEAIAFANLNVVKYLGWKGSPIPTAVDFNMFSESLPHEHKLMIIQYCRKQTSRETILTLLSTRAVKRLGVHSNIRLMEPGLVRSLFNMLE
jgi:ankyrin repeat protein